MLGKDPTTLYTSVHSQVEGAVKKSGTHFYTSSGIKVTDLSAGFHTYGVDWQPDTITWYLDGKKVSQAKTPADMNKPMYMIANLAVGGAWGGNADATTPFPAEMKIDYIRAYTAAPTVLTKPPGDGTLEVGALALNPVYRFYDRDKGDHFYTTSAEEKASIQANLKNMSYEGVQWSTPDKGAGTIDVYRFYKNDGTHLYTSNVTEKDAIIANLKDYTYEGVAFQAYSSPSVVSDGAALTLTRFYNTKTGEHHLAASQAEVDGLTAQGWGTSEGPAFTVHQPIPGSGMAEWMM